MLPMAHAAGLHMGAEALTQAKLALRNIGSKLQLLELGNEPNLYHEQGMHGAQYDVARYLSEALQHEADIEGNVTAVKRVKYQALAYDSGVSHAVWNEEKAFGAGINRNARIGSVSWHYYQSVSSGGVTLRKTLMVCISVYFPIPIFQMTTDGGS